MISSVCLVSCLWLSLLLHTLSQHLSTPASILISPSLFRDKLQCEFGLRGSREAKREAWRYGRQSRLAVIADLDLGIGDMRGPRSFDRSSSHIFNLLTSVRTTQSGLVSKAITKWSTSIPVPSVIFHFGSLKAGDLSVHGNGRFKMAG